MAAHVLFCQTAIAGGGPENLVLVVNADSASSKLVANHYIQLRNIPANHVIYLTGIKDVETITEKVFKTQILEPVFQQIKQRRLNNSIDYIVYSTGFPTRVKIDDLRKRLFEKAEQQGNPIPEGMKRVFGGVASITSLTYFAPHFLSNDPSLLLLDSNWYYRGLTNKLLSNPFIGATQDAYQKTLAKLEGDDVDSAIQSLQQMTKSHPHQVALTYNIARGYGKKSNALEAANWLIKSARLGWVYRNHTRSDMAFESIADSKPFREALAKIADEDFKYLPSMSLSSRYTWGPNGFRNGGRDQGKSVILSTMLATTRNMGISEQQAIESLKLNASSDGNPPQGSVFFSDVKTEVRSRTRKPGFQDAIDALEKLEIKSVVGQQNLPKGLQVAGGVLGNTTINWPASGSTISPGAIVENLTSYGGTFEIKGHTKCTEFLKWGAAGSSGTVAEPFAIQAKFPHPMIQVHYARGCSLAESFYQSVHGPFQLIIVGDALCQPFAQRPRFEVTGLREKQVLESPIQAQIEFEPGITVAAMEIYLDGILFSRNRPTNELSLDTTKISDGYHEITLVAIADNRIATSFRRSFPVFVRNTGNRIDLSSSKRSWDIDQTVEVSVKSNFGNRVEIMHNGRVVGKRNGKTGVIKIPAAELGRGPITLSAVAFPSDDSGKRVRSVPIDLNIVGSISTKIPVTSAGLRKKLGGKTER